MSPPYEKQSQMVRISEENEQVTPVVSGNNLWKIVELANTPSASLAPSHERHTSRL